MGNLGEEIFQVFGAVVHDGLLMRIAKEGVENVRPFLREMSSTIGDVLVKVLVADEKGKPSYRMVKLSELVGLNPLNCIPEGSGLSMETRIATDLISPEVPVAKLPSIRGMESNPAPHKVGSYFYGLDCNGRPITVTLTYGDSEKNQPLIKSVLITSHATLDDLVGQVDVLDLAQLPYRLLAGYCGRLKNTAGLLMDILQRSSNQISAIDLALNARARKEPSLSETGKT